MIQIVAGDKGKGKTKILIDKVNIDVKESKGSIVYLDKNTKHMYELNNKIRLINVRDYCIEDPNEFLGFICGLIAGDHDLQKIYLDSFLKLTCTSDLDIERILQKIELISTKFEVDFLISISMNKDELPEFAKKYVVVSL